MRTQAPKLRKKAKPKSANPVHAAAEANETKVAAAFAGSLVVLRNGVNQERLLVALQRNDIGTAIDSFPWDMWSATLGRMLLPRLTETMRQAGEGVGRGTVVQKDFTLRGIFDIKNPRAIRIAAEISARLVTRVVDATKWAMRQVIADGQREGLSVRGQAEQIKAILVEQAGLDGPRARRLEAFRRSQAATGAQPQVVAARVAQQRDRLIWDRARTISRHETQAAATAGQAEAWEQAVEVGLLPTTQVYEWLTADEGGGRVCPICLPMNGQRVRRGQLFKSPEDGSTHAGPPAHVMCRCTLVLVDPFEDEVTKYDPNQPRDEQGQWTDGGPPLEPWKWDAPPTVAPPSYEERLVSLEREAQAERAARSDAQMVEDYTRTGGTYRDINQGLRDGKAVADLEEAATVGILDRLIAEGGHDGSPLYRGMAGWEPSELGLEEGYEFADPGFVSTARDKAVAKKFAMSGEQEMSGESVGILFTIKKARRGVNLDAFARYGESETLLARGTRFRVVKVTEGYPGEKLATVTLEVIG